MEEPRKRGCCSDRQSVASGGRTTIIAAPDSCAPVYHHDEDRLRHLAPGSKSMPVGRMVLMRPSLPGLTTNFCHAIGRAQNGRWLVRRRTFSVRSHEIFLYQRRVIASRVLETWGAEPPSSCGMRSRMMPTPYLQSGEAGRPLISRHAIDRFAISSPGPRFHMILGCDETR